MTQPASVTDITMMRAALKYAAGGWAVFPVHSVRLVGERLLCTCNRECGRPGKHPRTANGWKDATIDQAVIEKWWKEWPDANIGLACGPSRLLVVDVDPRNDGDESFRELEARHGKFPQTLTSLTGGGGQHYFYDVTANEGAFRGRVLAQGIELQGSGQYVVLPPSIHASGRRYQWDYGQGEAVVFPPSWIVEEEARKSRFVGTIGAPLDCIMGVAFSAAGMMGHPLGPDRVTVQCPWEGEHTSGSRFDSSTIVFGAAPGGRWGFFHCSHAHCKTRLAGLRGIQKLHEVLRALPENAAKFASERIKGADRDIRRMVRAKWEESLVWDGKGEKLIDSPGNLKLMLDNIKEWSGLVAYDESKDRLFWTSEPPELTGMKRPHGGGEIREYDWVYVAHWFSVHRQVTFPKNTAADQLVASGQDNMHNSLVNYIEGLKWDGKERVGSWLTTFCGAEDTEVNRKVGKCWLVSAIARALNPGCQVDHVLVLEGKQGSGKTSVFRTLGGDWYLGHLPRLEDKDARHVLSGAWIIEMQELAATRASRIELVKAYLTERWDQYRPPYGRNFVKRPRRCVFGASVNENEYVADSTGARRFWPVPIGVPDIERLKAERDMLWAEARELYLNGEAWHVNAGEGVARELAEAQAARIMGDPWESMVERYVAGKDMVRTEEVLGSLPGLEPGKWAPRDASRVAGIMQALGYFRRKVTVADGRREWRWCLPAGRGPVG